MNIVHVGPTAALPEIIKLKKMGKGRLKLSLMLRDDYGG